jgi:hypothetical protein
MVGKTLSMAQLVRFVSTKRLIIQYASDEINLTNKITAYWPTAQVDVAEQIEISVETYRVLHFKAVWLTQVLSL